MHLPESFDNITKLPKWSPNKSRKQSDESAEDEIEELLDEQLEKVGEDYWEGTRQLDGFELEVNFPGLPIVRD